MTRTTVSLRALSRLSWMSRALIYALVGLTIPTPSSATHADNVPEDLTTLSIEELLEVEISRHAVSILHSHIHKQGEWMIGYRYMTMDMDGNRDGTTAVSTTSVLTDFAITPTAMRMQSHMVNVMYAPSDDLTMMATLPYKILSMDHVTRTGLNFTTRAEGIGDLSVMPLCFIPCTARSAIVFFIGWNGLSYGFDRRERPNPGRPQPETTLSHAIGLRNLRSKNWG